MKRAISSPSSFVLGNIICWTGGYFATMLWYLLHIVWCDGQWNRTWSSFSSTEQATQRRFVGLLKKWEANTGEGIGAVKFRIPGKIILGIIAIPSVPKVQNNAFPTSWWKKLISNSHLLPGKSSVPEICNFLKSPLILKFPEVLEPPIPPLIFHTPIDWPKTWYLLRRNEQTTLKRDARLRVYAYLCECVVCVFISEYRYVSDAIAFV